MSSDGSSSASTAASYVGGGGSSKEANTSSSAPINASNSFYASFKIYINRFSGSSSQTSKAQPPPPKSTTSASTGLASANNAYSTKSKGLPTPSSTTPSSQKSQIVRIERIECDEDDEVFLENPQNVEVHIKVEPPKSSEQSRLTRENSPVFYLEPDDWSDEVAVVPKVVTSPTRALSPCGCGKSHLVNHKTGKMAALPEEPTLARNHISNPPPPNYLKSSSSGSYLPLPSPRAAIMSELAQQNRQRKVTIPLLSMNRAVRPPFNKRPKSQQNSHNRRLL